MKSSSRRTARTLASIATGRAKPWLSAALAALVFPAAASATVTLDQFTVTPASTQAGSHPNVTIYQHLTPSSADDDVRNTFVRLGPSTATRISPMISCGKLRSTSVPAVISLSITPPK